MPVSDQEIWMAANLIINRLGAEARREIGPQPLLIERRMHGIAGSRMGQPKLQQRAGG